MANNCNFERVHVSNEFEKTGSKHTFFDFEKM